MSYLSCLSTLLILIRMWISTPQITDQSLVRVYSFDLFPQVESGSETNSCSGTDTVEGNDGTVSSNCQTLNLNT